jgi:5-formyltetrahydrofolate cyclo-ligase
MNRIDPTRAQAVSAAKQSLRLEMIRLRRQVTPEEASAASERLADRCADLLARRFPDGGPRQVAVYAAFRNELNLDGCIKRLLRCQATVYFPAVYAGCLRFACLPPGVCWQDWLQPGHFGVPEPPPHLLLADLPAFDLLLIPGLAFDRTGQRLGWGKAYYDQLLAQIKPAALRVGVAWPFQICTALPQEAHDQRMDILLTPDGWFACADIANAQSMVK